MSHSGTEQKLVMMANQIARAFEAQGEEKAVPMIHDHIVQFWDPRMRRQMNEHILAGGEGLLPTALAALKPDAEASRTAA